MPWRHLSINVLPLLAAISPLIGLITSVVVTRWNRLLVRPMVLSNAAMTTVLVTAMIAVYKPDNAAENGGSARQMQSSIDWLQERDAAGRTKEEGVPRGISVQLSFGVDGLCLWPALLLTITVWSALLFPGRRLEESYSAFSGWVLLTESLLLASLLASDAIAGLVLNEAALLPVYCLVGASGNASRRKAADALLTWQFVGCACSLFGVTLLAVSRPWMQSDLVPHRGPLILDASVLLENLQHLLLRSETALHLWSDVAPWACLFLMLGLAMRLPVFPFHRWYEAVLNSAPPGAAVLTAAVFPIVALNGWLRLGWPLYYEGGTIFSGLLLVFSLMGLWRSGLLASKKTDLRQLLTSISTGLLCLSCAGSAVPHHDGVRGASLLTLSQGLAVAVGVLTLEMLSRRCQTCELLQLGPILRRHPRLAAVLITALLGWAGMPFLSGVAPLILIFYATAGSSIVVVLCESIAVALMAGAVVRAIYKCTSNAAGASPDGGKGTTVNPTGYILDGDRNPTQRKDSPQHEAAGDLSFSELCTVVPQLVLLLALNLYPSFVLDSCEPSLRRLFRDAPQAGHATVAAPNRAMTSIELMQHD